MSLRPSIRRAALALAFLVLATLTAGSEAFAASAPAGPEPPAARLATGSVGPVPAGFEVRESRVPLDTTGRAADLRLLFPAGFGRKADRLAQEAGFALATLARLWGPPPGDGFSLLLSPLELLPASLPERSQVVLVERFGDPFREEAEALCLALARQWWRDLFAGDGSEEPYLEEGLITYTAARLFAARHGGRPAGVRIGGLALPLPLPPLAPFRAMRARLLAGAPTDPLARARDGYRDRASRTLLTHDGMALAFAEIASRLGEERFDRGLALFAARHRGGRAHADDLVRALGAVAVEDLWPLWQELTGQPGLADFAVTGVRSEPDPSTPERMASHALVVHRGGPRLPLVVELRFADGSRRRVVWDARSAWLRLHAAGPRLVEVHLDPGEDALLVHWSADDARLVVPDPAPRRRFTQRLRFFAQLVLEALADLA